MYPANPLLMIAFVAVTFLANYGAGAALSQVARLRLGTAPERFGVSCALGSIVLSWVGYAACMARLPWLPGPVCWLAVAAGVVVIARGLRGRAEGESLPRRDWLLLGLAVGLALLFAGGSQWGQIRY
ncbi:MAG: hypothetical protein WCP21_11415, partial [Armatimonadota bacterium]